MAKHFVTAADEVWRLQRGTDPECALFRAMAEEGHYGGQPGSTRQGIYVCAPSGTFLASINSTRPERVLAMLEQALAAWRDLPEEKRYLDADTNVRPTHRWEHSYPEDGLVLTMLTRDLPFACRPEAPSEVKWNQDKIWFSREEARRWIPPDPMVGASYPIPEKLIARLARFHLVDTVRGQTTAYRAPEVAESSIEAVVTARAENRVTIEFSGRTKSDSQGRRRDGAHGIATQLRGSATYDLDRSAFEAFEIVALGRRWGRTRHNGRWREPETSPLGFVIRLAKPNSPRVAPAFIFAYDADWVKRPPPRSFRRRISGTRETPGEGLHGRWALSLGSRTMKLEFAADGSGTWTTSEGDSLALRSVRLDSHRLTFEVTFEFGARKVPMRFDGTLEDSKLTGELSRVVR